MVMTHESVFGKKKGDGPGEDPSPFNKFKRQDRIDEDKEPDEMTEGGQMESKKYIVQIDGFTEKGARHLKGDALKVEIDDARAQALIGAGYIAEEGKPVEAPEAKNIEAPEKKVITGDQTDKKGASGKGASLLKSKKK